MMVLEEKPDQCGFYRIQEAKHASMHHRVGFTSRHQAAQPQAKVSARDHALAQRGVPRLTCCSLWSERV